MDSPQPGIKSVRHIKLNKHQLPENKEVLNKDWIYWGKNNDYPNYLLKLFTRSAKHNAILTAKAMYIAGTGFTVDNPTTSVADKALILSFLNKANESEAYNQLADKVIIDWEIFNGFALEIIWNKSGRDFELYHLPFNNVRVGKDGEEYFYTSQWIKDGRPNFKPEDEDDFEVYQKFDPDKRKGKQIIYYTCYRPDTSYYPIPDYVGAIPYAEMDYEVANFWLNNIKNGFAGGTIINLNNGYPKNDEDADAIIEDLKASFTGTDNAGELVVIFSDNKERAVEILPVRGNDFDKIYIQLNETVQQEMFTGHKISSPMILGVKTPGQLGGRTEMREAFELLTNTYVKKRRKPILDIFNMILEFKKLPPVLSIGNLEPITQETSEASKLQVMTRDEQRKSLGLPKEEKQESASALIDSINSLSPLVANKVIENLTVDELRKLVGLGAIGTQTPSGKVYDNPQGFSSQLKFSEKEEIEVFKKYGKSKQDFKVISSKSFKFNDYEQVWKDEVKMRQEFAKVLVINDMQASIIDLILKDPLITPEKIIEVIGKNEAQVREAIGKLVENKIIAEKGLGGWSVDKAAAETVKSSEVQTTDIFVAYSYELRPDAPPLQPGGKSREFCVELITLNRFYERSDIEMISAEVGRNVWLTRGGFYHNPKTNETTPYCRHDWVASIVSKNKNE